MSLYTRLYQYVRGTLAKGSHVRGDLDAVVSAFNSVESSLNSLSARVGDVEDELAGLEGSTFEAGFPGSSDTRWYIPDTSGGSTTTYTGVTNPAATGENIPTGFAFWYIPTATNTGASTLNLGSTEGAVQWRKYEAGSKVALQAGDLIAGRPSETYYDGTHFVLTNPPQQRNYNDKELKRPVLQDYAEELVTTAAPGATYTLNHENANNYKVTLDQDCMFSFSNWPASGDLGSITLLINPASYTPTWPGAVDWGDAGAPSLTANKWALLIFSTVNGGTNVAGALVGQGFTTL